jgi:tetratricopeptide (TPR) repeat protein
MGRTHLTATILAICAVCATAPLAASSRPFRPVEAPTSWAKEIAQKEVPLDHLNRIIEKSPNLLRAYQVKASILLSMDRQAEAATVADEVVAANPEQTEAYHIAASIYAALDFRDKALAMIDRWIKIRPHAIDPEALVMRASMRRWDDFDERESDVSTVLRANPEYLSGLYAKGELEYDRGEFTAAVQTYTKIRKLGQDAPVTLNLLGFSLFRAGQLKKADEVFEIAREHSHDRSTLSSLCWGKVTFGIALDRALEECNAALVYTPDNPNILDSRAMIYLRLGNFDLALADYDRALKHSPSQANSLFGRAIVRARQGQADLARADAQAARRLWPDVDDSYRKWAIPIPHEIALEVTQQ